MLCPVFASIGVDALGVCRSGFGQPYTNTNASTATKEAVSVVYQAVHQYGGVLIGEHLGQTLLIGWTLGVGIAMRSSPLFKSWVAWWGLLTTPLLLLGQSELISTVIPSIPVIEATPVGFILWEVWLLIIGISLLRVPKNDCLIKQKRFNSRCQPHIFPYI